MAKANYHQASGPVLLDIIGKAKGGKVDLGQDKEVIVSGVTISEEPVIGTCTLVEESKKEAPKSGAESGGGAGNTTAPEGTGGGASDLDLDK